MINCPRRRQWGKDNLVIVLLGDNLFKCIRSSGNNNNSWFILKTCLHEGVPGLTAAGPFKHWRTRSVVVAGLLPAAIPGLHFLYWFCLCLLNIDLIQVTIFFCPPPHHPVSFHTCPPTPSSLRPAPPPPAPQPPSTVSCLLFRVPRLTVRNLAPSNDSPPTIGSFLLSRHFFVFSLYLHLLHLLHISFFFAVGGGGCRVCLVEGDVLYSYPIILLSLPTCQTMLMPLKEEGESVPLSFSRLENGHVGCLVAASEVPRAAVGRCPGIGDSIIGIEAAAAEAIRPSSRLNAVRWS